MWSGSVSSFFTQRSSLRRLQWPIDFSPFEAMVKNRLLRYRSFSTGLNGRSIDVSREARSAPSLRGEGLWLIICQPFTCYVAGRVIWGLGIVVGLTRPPFSRERPRRRRKAPEARKCLLRVINSSLSRVNPRLIAPVSSVDLELTVSGLSDFVAVGFEFLVTALSPSRSWIQIPAG